MTKQEFLDKYLVQRRGTDCLKWDRLNELYGDSDLISMWIADTEFKTCDEILEALHKRIDHGAFGYSVLPEDYADAFSGWMQRHHGFRIDKEWLRFSAGCVSGIAWLLNTFTEPGDACLILTPVYYPFHNVIKENNRRLVTVDLHYENGTFSTDLKAMEQAIVENKVKLFIQCSPHNPIGRVWSEYELDAVLALCRKHNVLVISDEIHQDIILWGKSFVPALAVRNGEYQDIVMVVTSVSKTFNLPGLLHSHIIIADQNLRNRYDEFAKRFHCTGTNLLGQIAARAGYRYGDEWLKAFLEVIEDNYTYLKKTLETNAPQITVCNLEGTFLPLLDLRKVVAPKDVQDFIVKKCHLAVDYGEQFGEGYQGFIRLNIATDPQLVANAVDNILRALH